MQRRTDYARTGRWVSGDYHVISKKTRTMTVSTGRPTARWCRARRSCLQRFERECRKARFGRIIQSKLKRKGDLQAWREESLMSAPDWPCRLYDTMTMTYCSAIQTHALGSPVRFNTAATKVPSNPFFPAIENSNVNRRKQQDSEPKAHP
jgi:hypothetical protein